MLITLFSLHAHHLFVYHVTLHVHTCIQVPLEQDSLTNRSRLSFQSQNWILFKSLGFVVLASLHQNPRKKRNLLSWHVPKLCTHLLVLPMWRPKICFRLEPEKDSKGSTVIGIDYRIVEVRQKCGRSALTPLKQNCSYRENLSLLNVTKEDTWKSIHSLTRHWHKAWFDAELGRLLQVVIFPTFIQIDHLISKVTQLWRTMEKVDEHF